MLYLSVLTMHFFVFISMLLLVILFTFPRILWLQSFLNNVEPVILELSNFLIVKSLPFVLLITLLQRSVALIVLISFLLLLVFRLIVIFISVGPSIVIPITPLSVSTFARTSLSISTISVLSIFLSVVILVLSIRFSITIVLVMFLLFYLFLFFSLSLFIRKILFVFIQFRKLHRLLIRLIINPSIFILSF